MTTNSQGWELPAEGAHRADSKIVSMASSETGSSFRNPARMLRRRLSTSRNASIDSTGREGRNVGEVSEDIIQILHCRKEHRTRTGIGRRQRQEHRDA